MSFSFKFLGEMRDSWEEMIWGEEMRRNYKIEKESSREDMSESIGRTPKINEIHCKQDVED